MEIRVLGAQQVVRDGDLLPLGPPKQRLLLAVLVSRAGQPVSAGYLSEALWGPTPPPSAGENIYLYVSRLRKAIGAERIVKPDRSVYLLKIEPDELDAYRFRELAQAGIEARGAHDVALASQRLREALGLWRGVPFADLPDEPALRETTVRLTEERLVAVEHRIEADLALGRHADLSGELQELLGVHPYREQLYAQLMLALYRSGRQAEALEVYQRSRRTLDEDLGLEPSVDLRRLHQAILTGDPDLRHVPVEPAEPATRARPAEPPPAQLPPTTLDFIGRRRELTCLDEFSAPSATDGAVGVVAVTGAAGVGKTALALHCAHRVAARFPDGQLHVDLRGFGPGKPVAPLVALVGFLGALGVAPGQIPADEDAVAALYRTRLAGKRVLVMLDNAATAEQVRPLLPGSAGCFVVVTSRNRLSGLIARDGAHWQALDLLPPADAAELLIRILGDDRVRAEPQPTKELAAACGYLPLALRIAAANLAGRPSATIAEYVDALRDGDRLAALRIEGDEQFAVRSVFERSYTALRPPARRLFRRVGLVPGPDFTAAAAAALMGVSRAEAGALLDTLADGHLVEQHTPGRYQLHDLLRDYARERIHLDEGDGERQAATVRLFDYYLSNVDAAAQVLYPQVLRLPLPELDATNPPAEVFADHTSALSWLTIERANLVAAVIHAAEHGPRRSAWLIADGLRGYFYLSTHVVGWLCCARAALAAAEAEGDLLGQAAALMSLGTAYWRGSQPQPATASYARALSIAEQIAWHDGEAAIQGNRSGIYRQSGQLARAATDLTRALMINRKSGRRAGQAGNLTTLGALNWELGRLREAVAYSQEALGLYLELRSRSGEAIVRSNLGELYHALGDPDRALGELQRASELHHDVGNSDGGADTLRCLAKVHCDAGRVGEAVRAAEEAWTLARDTSYHRLQADVLNTLGTIDRSTKRYAKAMARHEHALRLARTSNNRYPEIDALIGLAEVHNELLQPATAARHACEALAFTRSAGFRGLEGTARNCLAQALLDAGRPDESAREAREALIVHRETGHRAGEQRALAILSQLGSAADSGPVRRCDEVRADMLA